MRKIAILFLSFLTALLMAFIFTCFFGNQFLKIITPSTSKNREKVIVGKQEKLSGKEANLLQGDTVELELISSIKNEKQLTLFGSSEFTDSPYCSYNFLPDSLGFQSMGIGHAFHQSLCILCELLAVNQWLENSKICIVVSPSWFYSPGTNTSAFIEFVRPDFLKRIANDNNIESEFKTRISDYLFDYDTLFSELSPEMKYLKELNHPVEKIEDKEISYLKSLSDVLRTYVVNIHEMKPLPEVNIHEMKPLPEVRYETELSYMKSKPYNWNLEASLKKLQQEFISNITNNDIFVYDEYFQKYLQNEDGSAKSSTFNPISSTDNRELEDFRLLVKFLKSRKAKCSFIIVPLNPYYYTNLDVFKPVLNEVISELETNNFPYYNMFVYEKQDYDAGSLKDVMHLGDYGWLEVNYFLDNIYRER